MQVNDQLKAKILSLPKIELHIHLEGCINLQTLKFLVKKNKIAIPDHLANEKNIYFNNFDEFVSTFYAICNALKEEEDFKFIAKDLVDYVKRNNIIYCEVSWTPFRYMEQGLNFSRIMNVLNNEIAGNNLSNCIYFIIDTQRDHGINIGERVFSNVSKVKDCNIVGIGLTGQEENFPASVYADIYSRMRDKGYGCTAHAGEYGSANDIWQCIKDLQVKRIGHGIRAISDTGLIDYIKENNIHLEISPTSNIRLRRIDNYCNHPIKDFRDMALNIGINSDDPGIFNTDLTDEYMNLMTELDFDISTLKQCNIRAAEASFATTQTKGNLLATINQNWP